MESAIETRENILVRIIGIISTLSIKSYQIDTLQHELSYSKLSPSEKSQLNRLLRTRNAQYGELSHMVTNLGRLWGFYPDPMPHLPNKIHETPK